MLMGKQAQSFKDYIDDKFNCIVETPHPAGLARAHKKLPSQLWKDINCTLARQNGYGIEWYEENGEAQLLEAQEQLKRRS